MTQLAGERVEIWRERDGRLRAQEIIRFAAGPFGELGKVVLPPIHSPVAMAKMTHARSVDRIYDNTGALGIFNGLVYVRIGIRAWIKGVNTIGDHEYFPPLDRRADGPFFHEIHQREIRTGFSADETLRQA